MTVMLSMTPSTLGSHIIEQDQLLNLQVLKPQPHSDQDKILLMSLAIPLNVASVIAFITGLINVLMLLVCHTPIVGALPSTGGHLEVGQTAVVGEVASSD
jgi:hypothetical protein